MSEAKIGGGDVFWSQDVVHRVSELIQSAEKHVSLVSPYVDLDGLRLLATEISSALKRHVQVQLVVRSRDGSNKRDVTSSAVTKELCELGLKLREVRDLHAKIYLSEKSAILTSLNLLPSSFNNSLEIGVRVDAGTGEYKQIHQFLRTRINEQARDLHDTEHGARATPPTKLKAKAGRRSKRREVELKNDEGFCIRCDEDIELDPDRPYCRECYREWLGKDDGDKQTREKYCHDCGDEARTCLTKPLCRSCYELQAA